MAMTRKSLAEIIEGYDAQVAELQASKRTTYDDYRHDLAKSGYDKDAVKAEIEAFKLALRRKANVKKTSDEAVAAQDELVDEIFAEITAARAPRATRVANPVPDHDPITGEIADETPMSHASGQPAGDDPETPDDAASAGETATNTRRMSMTPLEPREAGGLKGFGFTVRFDEPDAALRPQTAGSETAVANSTPGSGAGTVDAGEANWPSEMTTASPANEPETIPPVADPATVVSEAANGDSAPSLAAIPVADQSKPNPICRDPGDCGVYASWAMPCQACKAAAAHRSAA